MFVYKGVRDMLAIHPNDFTYDGDPRLRKGVISNWRNFILLVREGSCDFFRIDPEGGESIFELILHASYAQSNKMLYHLLSRESVRNEIKDDWLDFQNGFGNTMLHRVMQVEAGIMVDENVQGIAKAKEIVEKYAPITKWLIERGASITIPNGKGTTPFQMMVRKDGAVAASVMRFLFSRLNRTHSEDMIGLVQHFLHLDGEDVPESVFDYAAKVGNSRLELVKKSILKVIDICFQRVGVKRGFVVTVPKDYGWIEPELLFEMCNTNLLLTQRLEKLQKYIETATYSDLTSIAQCPEWKGEPYWRLRFRYLMDMNDIEQLVNEFTAALK